MMRILMLDDDINRVVQLKTSIDPKHEFCWITYAQGCISLLQNDYRWDVLLLDHDLGGEVFVNTDREDCGYEVVRFTISEKPNVGIIIVHTFNPIGMKMLEDLRNAGYSAFFQPFNPAIIASAIESIK